MSDVGESSSLTLEDVFERWHQRFAPEPGWITLSEAVERYTSLGLSCPLPEVLTRGEVSIVGKHMHGPGGPLPPWLMDVEEWSFDVKGNWAREVRYPKSLQYAVQVQIDKAQFEAALEAALSEERGEGAAAPTEPPPQPPQPPGAAGTLSRTHDLLQRPKPRTTDPRRQAVTCHVCGNSAQPATEGDTPIDWLFMGKRRDLEEPIFVCDECCDFITQNCGRTVER